MMKPFIFTLALCFVLLNVSGQKKELPPFNVRQMEKQFVEVTDSLYASIYECSNLDYRYFLEDLRRLNQWAERTQYAIDSIQWRNLNYFMEPYVLYYHNHPAYYHYPVVNMTQEAAKAYCAWLTRKYNESKKRKFKRVVFHLPTETEWILAANDGNPKSHKRFPVYDFAGMFLNGISGIQQANYLSIDQGCLLKDTVTNKIVFGCTLYNGSPARNVNTFLNKVNEFHPTKLGLYNMAGNVAEMLSELGRTKGGSWYTVGGYLGIYAPDPYRGFTKASAEIGFRVFMTVLEK